LKADFYIGLDGKPSGALLIIAFETSKIAKTAALATAQAAAPAMKHEVPSKAPDTHKAGPKSKVPSPVRVTVQQEESDWSTLYS